MAVVVVGIVVVETNVVVGAWEVVAAGRVAKAGKIPWGCDGTCTACNGPFVGKAI